MKIFFDENFSLYLSKGFSNFQQGRRKEGFDVLHLLDKFPKGIADEEWIPKLAQMHSVVITQDLNIHTTNSLFELCLKHKLGFFFFKPPKKKNTHIGNG